LVLLQALEKYHLLGDTVEERRFSAVKSILHLTGLQPCGRSVRF
jgi:hypothetical protein